jgi:hypothetical protein
MSGPRLLFSAMAIRISRSKQFRCQFKAKF